MYKSLPFINSRMELVTISKSAADWIGKQLQERGRGLGVRVGVTPSGCTGWKYIIEYADHQSIEDVVVEEHGVTVFIDPKSLLYLSGSLIDFKREGINSGIEISNPKATAHCGCGESFAI